MPVVRTEIDEGVAVLTLDDPDRRNALSLEMVEQIVDALDTIERGDEVGAVVVTGTPPAFCAGANLSQLGGSRREGLRRVYEGFLRLGRCRLPTIAAVNGPAVGAGLNMALVCDLRLAGRAARFDTRFLDLGIHPGGGHTWMLRNAVGTQAAMAMVLFGEMIDGEEAARLGLAWRCVDDDELLGVARRMAARAASVPRELLVRTKATLAEMAHVDDHEGAVDRELEVQLWSIEQPEFAERLAELRRRIEGTGDGR